MLKQKSAVAHIAHVSIIALLAAVVAVLIATISVPEAKENKNISKTITPVVIAQCPPVPVSTKKPKSKPKQIKEPVYKTSGISADIDEDQAELLIYAYNTAKADGHKDPTFLQGLIWQESHAGGFPGHEVAGDEYGLSVGKRYYGIGQIKVAAAKDVFKRFADEFPNFYEKSKRIPLADGTVKTIPGRYLMTDDQIIAYLITDKKFNIRVASKYLWMMQHKEQDGEIVYVRPINYAVTAYNRGLGNTYDTDYNNWHYTVAINKYRKTWIPKFNEANKQYLKSDQQLASST